MSALPIRPRSAVVLAVAFVLFAVVGVVTTLGWLIPGG